MKYNNKLSIKNTELVKLRYILNTEYKHKKISSWYYGKITPKKNRYITCEDIVVVDIGYNLYILMDQDDLNILDKHIIHSRLRNDKPLAYVGTGISLKTVIAKNKNVRHKNGNTLDLRKSNLIRGLKGNTLENDIKFLYESDTNSYYWKYKINNVINKEVCNINNNYEKFLKIIKYFEDN